MLIASRSDGLVIDDDPDRLDRDRIQHWISVESYWAAGRERDLMDRALAGSRVFGVYRPARAEQVALARVVSDGATYAWICDVFVDSASRGAGIGTWLMQTVVGELQSQGITRLALATRDAHEIYRRVGFGPLRVASTWMEIDNRSTRLPAGD